MDARRCAESVTEIPALAWICGFFRFDATFSILDILPNCQPIASSF